MTVTNTVRDATRKVSTRELRALVLAEERFEEIARSHRGGLYTVPSLHGDHTYAVTYTAREESGQRRACVLGAVVASGIGIWSSVSRATTTT
jgi:hypothetical protein